MEIHFYTYNGHPDTINKTLGAPFVVSGALVGNCDLLTPIVDVRLDAVPTYNYCYIPLFRRYYFITEITINGGVYSVEMDIDVLKTYSTQILVSRGTMTETDTPANGYLSNRTNVYDVRPQNSVLAFENTELFTDNGDMLMITIKGNTNGNN